MELIYLAAGLMMGLAAIGAAIDQIVAIVASFNPGMLA